MTASPVLTLPISPTFAAPNQVPPFSFSAILWLAVLTGVLTIPELVGLSPLARAAAMFTLSGIAGTGGGGASSIMKGVRGVAPLLWLRRCGPGLGERKVRSVMDPEDDCLLRLCGLTEARPLL